MNIIKIAFRSIQQRGVASILTMLSMALGVTLVVCVLSIHGIIAQQFRSNSSLGYNMIVGAQGGKLQLTLNSVFYLSEPIENISYEFYLEFKRKEIRDKELRELSLLSEVKEVQWDASETLMAAGLSGSLLSLAEATQEELVAQDERLDLGREGSYGQFVTLAIPLCLGDYLDQYRVVGTTPDMFNELKFGDSADRAYEFSEGRNFVEYSEEHGYFEAVLGHHVAKKLGLKVGDTISPAHGAPDGHEHAQKFTIVGVLAPSGTPNDRAAFVNMEGFFLMADHAKPIEDEGLFGGGGPRHLTDDELEERRLAAANRPKRLPLEQREVTAILVRTLNPMIAVGLPTAIEGTKQAQAVLPIAEIHTLFSRIVGPVQQLFIALTLVICLVSGVSILVSIYNSMNDRRREIAIMRALGASRSMIMMIILSEAILLSLFGGAMGWVGGHTINAMASDYIEDSTGVQIGFFDLAPPINVLELFTDSSSETANMLFSWSPELLLIPMLMVLAAAVGLWPAISAYRTDVAQSL